MNASEEVNIVILLDFFEYSDVAHPSLVKCSTHSVLKESMSLFHKGKIVLLRSFFTFTQMPGQFLV